MIYDIRQTSRTDYETEVGYARHAIRLIPADRPGQRLVSMALEIDPPPAEWTRERDFFGNSIALVAIEQAHEALTVVLEARVEVDAPRPPGATPAWEAVRTEAVTHPSLAPEAPAHFLFPSRALPLDPATLAFAAASFPPGRPVLDGARDLALRLKRHMTYAPGATEVDTPAAAALAARHGVCQDFAHIMVAGLRGLGLPAAYVSGYLRTEPPPGKPRLAGADATHAWVAIWCGAAAGWCGLDPTNGVVAGEDHIVVAIGRDFADVSPIDGVFIGSGRQKLAVAVDVVPLESEDG